jgi:hypothetical protein
MTYPGTMFGSPVQIAQTAEIRVTGRGAVNNWKSSRPNKLNLNGDNKSGVMPSSFQFSSDSNHSSSSQSGSLNHSMGELGGSESESPIGNASMTIYKCQMINPNRNCMCNTMYFCILSVMSM